VLPLCEQLQLAFIPYYPLASGLLTGKYRRGHAGPEGARLSAREQIATDAQWRIVEALARYAEERRMPLTDVAIGALLTQPAVASVITGATRPEQLATNAAAASWKPSAEDLEALRSLLS
jgi:aryl-alcohol dehydrogenase-like predicted oxidoreductase